MAQEKKKLRLGAWMEELQNAANKKLSVEFETKDGVRRSGRLTDLRMSELRLNGRKCELITEFVLNNDPTDAIPFFNIKSMDINGD
jgi:glycine cleavage system aminomethyltransferase T